MHTLRAVLLLLAVTLPVSAASPGNRLSHLDTGDPYHPSRSSPRLITPQWIGEEGVEAVVVLAIDDMRGHERWEAWLRPILHRLKQIDGRAPVSIMTCKIDPLHAHLQKWLDEGLSLEIHTIDHPCPLLKQRDFKAAKSTYDRCVDLLASVPRNRPVAFRMPCCDSLNTLSPRFFAGIFNATTEKGYFLKADSSVFNLLTPDDPELPRDLVLEPNGRDRFSKYLPQDRAFGNIIRDHPYPFVINRLCWEFPCVTPSDWQAQHLHGACNPATLADWKAALDAVVIKKGVFNLVFHPYDWMRNAQVVDLIDHAFAKHGRKVKFLTFREAVERLEKNVLGGHSLRAADGSDNGVRLLDLDKDGYVDVVIGNDRVQKTRLWQPATRTWKETTFPVQIVTRHKERLVDAGVRFGVVRPDGKASLLVRNEKVTGGWHFDGTTWIEDPDLLGGLDRAGQFFETAREGRDRGVRLIDLDGDGKCELVIGNETRREVFSWKAGWHSAGYGLPEGTRLVDANGRDAGFRFVDLDEDGRLDILYSTEEGSSVYLSRPGEKTGWRLARRWKPNHLGKLPPFVRDGIDNGAWFLDRALWVQNEYTASYKDLVDRRTFAELLSPADPEAKSPQTSLAALKPRSGFVSQLMASEPLVQSPIAFAWGPDARLWVVEMGDYPLGVDGKGKPGGRIKILEDTKGDGVYDKATIFLDNLPFPTGVLPWKKGILVTCAPDIFYVEDLGGGKAGKPEVLYTGFVKGNQQHRVNSLVWGLDNWIHVANGDSGGVIQSLKTGKTVNISGRDLRIRPDDGGLEAESGQTQYGRSRDDWGNWFGGNNSNPVWHFVLPDHYLRRNPQVAPPNGRLTVPTVGGPAPVFPISRTLPRFNDPWAANRFTSACSPIIYRDELFGPGYAGNSFVSEPVHNLVHREIVTPLGVTFTSKRALDEQRSEFLASSDNWFRPTMIQTGPDGALWVADMYRAVIEHPQWIPLDWQKKLDLRAGHDRGRIYRVYPVGAKPRAVVRLDKLDTAGLVAALDSANGWQRDLAHMRLLWKGERGAIPHLEKLARTSKRPTARLHAFCTLEGLGALQPDLLVEALRDEHPGLRRQAVRLCEGKLEKSAPLGTALLALLEDRDDPVRMQLAFTLGEWKDERAGRALGRLAVRAAGNPFQTAAVLSSVNRDNLPAVLSAVFETGNPPSTLVEGLLRLASVWKQDRATLQALQMLGRRSEKGYATWQFAGLASLLEGLDRRDSSLAQLRKEGGPEVRKAITELEALFRASRTTVADEKAPVERRRAALDLLGREAGHEKEDRDLLAGLLSPRVPDELQRAAVSPLARWSGDKAPGLLLAGWKSHGPTLRGRVLDVLLERDTGTKALLDALARKQISPAEIDAAHRQRLLEHRDKGIRTRAAEVLAGAVDRDRQKVIDSYLPALKLAGDSARGKEVYTKACATCHKLGGTGGEVGPDLTPVVSRPGEYLLEAIFDPNRAVEARYFNYLAELRDGRVLTGVLTNETSTSVTVVAADGKGVVVLRDNLETLTNSGKSAMPEGLERDLKPQDVADLLAWIRSGRKPKTFPGNRPEVIRPDGEGTLNLLATKAEIYGSSLVLEEKYSNLGYWSKPDDEASWTVNVARAGRYVVQLDFACEEGAAGNRFVIEAGKSRLEGKVVSTGNWDTYQNRQVGTVELAEGEQRLTMRPEGAIKGALIDLRGIRLVPVK